MKLENIIYAREVLGKNGKPFKLYKFRTMDIGAESFLEELIDEKGLNEIGKIDDDPRITNFGKFLRKYWIDELPQLYNLIRRDINLVGIRAKSEQDWSYYPREHKGRALKQYPGLMGVHYSEHSSCFDELINIEIKYLDKKEVRPYFTDIKYFFKIVKNIVKGLRSK